jgi:hypothetical protein
MRSVNDQIRARLNAFVTELSDLIRQATLSDMAEALRSAEGHAPARRPATSVAIADARKQRKVAVRKSVAPAKAPTVASPAAPPRVPESLAQLMERIHSHIKANPGQGVVPMATSLGISNKDLRMPIRKLVEENKVRSTGKTRGTRYFPK